MSDEILIRLSGTSDELVKAAESARTAIKGVGVDVEILNKQVPSQNLAKGFEEAAARAKSYEAELKIVGQAALDAAARETQLGLSLKESATQFGVQESSLRRHITLRQEAATAASTAAREQSTAAAEQVRQQAEITKAAEEAAKRQAATYAAVKQAGVGALVAIGAAATAAGIDYEKATSIIVEATGATGEKLKGLQADLKGVLGQVPESAQVVAAALGDLHTRLGLVGEPLQNTTKLFLDFARVNNVDVAESTRTVTQLLNDMGISADRIPEVLDKLTAAGQASGISVTALASNLGAADDALAEMGFGLDESIALFAQLEKAGTEPTAAIQALSLAMKNMAAEGVTDAKQALGILMDRIKAAPTLIEATALATKTFGKSAGTMAADIRGGKFEIDAMLKVVQTASGTLEQTAKDAQTTGDRLSILKNQIAATLEPIGSVVVGMGNLGLAAQGVMSLKGLGGLSPLLTKLVPGLIGTGTAATGAAGGVTALSGASRGLGAVLGGAGGLIALLGGAAAAYTLWKVSQVNDQTDRITKEIETVNRARAILKDAAVSDPKEAAKILEAFDLGKINAKLTETEGLTARVAEAWQRGSTAAKELGQSSAIAGDQIGATSLTIGGFGKAAMAAVAPTERLKLEKDALSAANKKFVDEMAKGGEGLKFAIINMDRTGKSAEFLADKYDVSVHSIARYKSELEKSVKAGKDAEAQSEKLAKAAEKEAGAYQKKLDALEKLGIVTKDTVTAAMAELAELMEAAGKDVSLERKLAALAPRLSDLQKLAKDSGIEVKELDEWMRRAADAAAKLHAAFMSGLPMPPIIQGLKELPGTVVDLNKVISVADIQVGNLTDSYKFFGLKTKAELASVAKDAQTHFTYLQSQGTATTEQLNTAHRKAIDAAVANADTIQQAQQIRLAGEVAILAEMTAKSHEWKAAAIAAQQAVVDAAARASGEFRTSWGGALGQVAGVFQSLVGLMESMPDTFGAKTTALIRSASGLAGTVTGVVQQIEADKKAGLAGATTWGSSSAVGQFQSATGTMGKTAAVAGGAMAALQGIGQMNQATDVAGMGNRIMGGAMSGMQTGMMIAGPYGAMAGLVIGAIVGALRKPEFEKVMKSVGAQYGTDISEGLARQIAKDAKDGKLGLGSKEAAELWSLDKIIGEAGGITAKNAGKFTKEFRDVFVMLETGKMTVEQTREVLEKNFGSFADQIVKSGTLATKEFREIIKLNREMGVESEQVQQFITNAATLAGQSVSVMIKAFAEQNKGFFAAKAAREELAKFDKELGKPITDMGIGETAQREALVNAAGPAPASADDIASAKKRLEVIDRERAAVATGALTPESQQLADVLTVKWEAAKADLNKMMGEAGKVSEDLNRISRLALTAFNASMAEGLSFTDAVNAAGPGLSQVLEAFKAIGEEPPAGLVKFAELQQRVKDNQGLLDATSATNELAKALSYMGGLTAEAMTDLSDQAARNNEQLLAAGFTERESLTQQKDLLVSLRDAYKAAGEPIPETTQKLLDQAVAQGVLKDEALSTNSIMIDGFAAIIEAVGGKLPEAFVKFRDAAKGAAKDVGTSLSAEVGAGIDATNTKLSQVEWAALKAKAADAGVSAGASVGGIGVAADALKEKLLKTEWETWSRTAITAGKAAKDGVLEAAGAAETVATKLGGINWGKFAGDAASAARTAKDAIDTVSFGASPGGIKEIPLQLAIAAKAAKDFEHETSKRFADLVRQVNEFSAPSFEVGELSDQLRHTGSFDDLASMIGPPPVSGGHRRTPDDADDRAQILRALEVQAAVQQQEMARMVEEVRRIAEMPTNVLVVEDGAIQLKALAINDADAMARQLTQLTLKTIAGNRDDSLRDFENLLNKVRPE